MPTTGLPGNIWYPDDTSPVAPLENLFLQLATSVNVALSSSSKILVAADLSALDAISSAIVGDIASVRSVGTGITGGVMFYAESGTGSGVKWRTILKIIASSKANLDTLKATIDALPDVSFSIGAEASIGTSKETYTWNGTKWELSRPYAEYGGDALTTAIAGSGGSAPFYWGGYETAPLPAGLFTIPPIVRVGPSDSGSSIYPGAQVSDVTTTSFTYRLFRIGAVPIAGARVSFMARQATSTSAKG